MDWEVVDRIVNDVKENGETRLSKPEDIVFFADTLRELKETFEGYEEYEDFRKISEPILTLYEVVLEQEPLNVKALIGKGWQLRDTEKKEEAVECLKKATELDPKNFDAWFGLGIVARNIKRYEDAINAFNRAIENNDKQRYTVKPLLALTYESLGRYDKAIETFQSHMTEPKEQADSSTQRFSNAELSRLYALNNQPEKAEECISRLRELTEQTIEQSIENQRKNFDGILGK